MISISVIYLVYPQLLIHIFDSQNQGTTQMDNARITEYVILILRLAVIFNLLDATRFIAMGSLRGAGDTFVPLLIGLATSWLIQIPGTVYLVYVAHASIGSVWLFITIYIAIDAFFMLWRRRSGAWKKIRVIDLPPPSGRRGGGSPACGRRLTGGRTGKHLRPPGGKGMKIMAFSGKDLKFPEYGV